MGTELRTAREKSGKTQAQVANSAEISVVAYQNYEYGKREPGVRTAIRIADAVGVVAYEEFRQLFFNI